MIVIITRRTYDRILRLGPRPSGHEDAFLTRDFAMLTIPDALGEALHLIHPHSEEAIRIILEAPIQ